MLKIFKLSLFALLLAANSYGAKCEDSTFDKIVYEDNIVEEEAQLGYGGQKLLEAIRDENVSTMYEMMIKFAGTTPQVSVRKLDSKNEEVESKRTVYTFRWWNRIGFSQRQLIATLEVQSFSNKRIADGGPNMYEVGPVLLDINSFAAQNLLENETVKESYDNIRQGGEVRIILKGIMPARNENESELTKYAFENWVGERLNLAFDVNSYFQIDTGERHFEVESIKVGYPGISFPETH